MQSIKGARLTTCVVATLLEQWRCLKLEHFGGPALIYSLAFLSFAAFFMVVSIATWGVVGWGIVLLQYIGASFVLLGLAYGAVGPDLLLKRATGCRSGLSWVMFAPYFLLYDVKFWMFRLMSREPAFAQVAPNLFFGRWLSVSEAAAIEWVSVLDLAAELAEVDPLRQLPGYRSLPVLDATAPTEVQLSSAVVWLVEAVKIGPVYVHCTYGLGRSACVVIAYLLSTGSVETVAGGVKLLESLRPGVCLNSAQRRQLRGFERLAMK